MNILHIRIKKQKNPPESLSRRPFQRFYKLGYKARIQGYNDYIQRYKSHISGYEDNIQRYKVPIQGYKNYISGYNLYILRQEGSI